MFRKIILVLLTVGFSTLYAGSAHNHSHDDHGHSHHEHNHSDAKLSSKDVQKIAKQTVEALVIEKKIPKSWKSIPVTKIGRDQSGNSIDWKIMFQNTKIKEKDKQILYIFVNIDGDVTGANYTGK